MSNRDAQWGIVRSLVVVISGNRNITIACIPTVREQLCFSGCKTSLFCLKYVQILWNSTLTNSINSSKSGPEASNLVSSAKRKSLSKEFSGRSLMYNKSIFFAFFTFFAFFRLIFVSLRFFRLIFAYFTFVFASDFWCFASKWIMWNQAFFSLPSETTPLQSQISLPKRKWGRTLIWR